MKKVIYSLDINYDKEMISLTKPHLEAWAKKIDAELVYITERKFPDMPPNYEKFQIYELGKDNDFSIFIDADCLISKDMPDITQFMDKNEVVFSRTDFANFRFKYDKYFERDGRNIGACTWCVIVTKNTIDAWKPIHLQDDITEQQIYDSIYPITIEKNQNIDSKHLMDDYLVSRNIAKFGLKVRTINDIDDKLNIKTKINTLFTHIYLDSMSFKKKLLKEVLNNWKTVSGSLEKQMEEQKKNAK